MAVAGLIGGIASASPISRLLRQARRRWTTWWTKSAASISRHAPARNGCWWTTTSLPGYKHWATLWPPLSNGAPDTGPPWKPPRPKHVKSPPERHWPAWITVSQVKPVRSGQVTAGASSGNITANSNLHHCFARCCYGQCLKECSLKLYCHGAMCCRAVPSSANRNEYPHWRAA